MIFHSLLLVITLHHFLVYYSRSIEHSSIQFLITFEISNRFHWFLFPYMITFPFRVDLCNQQEHRSKLSPRTAPLWPALSRWNMNAKSRWEARRVGATDILRSTWVLYPNDIVKARLSAGWYRGDSMAFIFPSRGTPHPWTRERNSNLTVMTVQKERLPYIVS